MDDLTLALRFAAALGLGVLLGLERERVKRPEVGFAGVRTFALIALLGAMAQHMQAAFEWPWLSGAVFAAVALLVAISYAVSATKGSLGITTEISALIVYWLGVLCTHGELRLAAFLAIGCLLVLALKNWLHELAKKIDSHDVEATLKFAIVTVIILPLVPDQDFGVPPLDVINPYKIWLMVVLISALDFASYVLVKFVGREHGIGLTGILGGLVSSTAVTLGFSKRSRQEPALSRALGLGIVLAWTIMFARVLVMIAVVDRALALSLLPPVGAMGLVSLGCCWVLWQKSRAATTAAVDAATNPFELTQAIRFGVLFGVITFAAKAAQVYLGTQGLYAAAALAGLTDVDAIALSMANMAGREPASSAQAATAVVIAVISNTLFKTGMAASVGAPELRRVIVPVALLIVSVGGAAVWLSAFGWSLRP